jgi:hypothetical protein
MGAVALAGLVLAGSIEAVRLKRLAAEYRQRASGHAACERIMRRHETFLLGIALEKDKEARWQADQLRELRELADARGWTHDELWRQRSAKLVENTLLFEKQAKEKAAKCREDAARVASITSHHGAWKQIYQEAASRPWLRIPQVPPQSYFEP